MESSFLINEFSKSNKLKILAVYPDEDLDAWKEHVSVMPKDWINSYDKSVSLKKRRDLRLKSDTHIIPIEQREESIVERCYFSTDRKLFITNN